MGTPTERETDANGGSYGDSFMKNALSTWIASVVWRSRLLLVLPNRISGTRNTIHKGTNYTIKLDGQPYHVPTVKERKRGHMERKFVCITEIFDLIRGVLLQLEHAGVGKVMEAVMDR